MTANPRPTSSPARPLAVLAALCLAAAPSPATAEQGGPDAGGYSYQDSAELTGPAYSFQDISGTGTPLLLSDDSVSEPIGIGFQFPFYGATYTQVSVSSNGFLTFDPAADSGCCAGAQMGTGAWPGNLVAGFWTDLYLPGGGSVTVQSTDVSFIAQFKEVPLISSGALETFQVKLFRDGSIEVHYASVVSDGHAVSAGIENADSTVGLQYRYGAFDLDQVAVRYSPPLPGVGDSHPTVDRHTFDEFPSGTPVAAAYPGYVYDGGRALCNAPFQLNSYGYPPTSGNCAYVANAGSGPTSTITIRVEPQRAPTQFEADFATGGYGPVQVVGKDANGVTRASGPCASSYTHATHCIFWSSVPFATITVTGLNGATPFGPQPAWTMDTAIFTGTGWDFT